MSSNPEENTEKVHDYSQKFIEDFNLIVVNPLPKLTDQENLSIVTFFGSYSQDKSVENNTKIIPTHVLNHMNENKSSANPSKHALTSYELLALKVFSIEQKYY